MSTSLDKKHAYFQEWIIPHRIAAMSAFQIDQIIKVAIHGIGSNGEGVGSCNGYTVFIDGALPNETVEARLIECQKRYGRAQLLKIEKPSSDRIEPPCQLFGKCGGCQLMHLSYPKQLEIKRQRVIDAMMRIGKLDKVHVESCLPSPLELGYRNKIQLPVKQNGARVALGLYERSSHRLVELEKCPIHCSLGEEAYSGVRPIIQRSGISAYDSGTGKGELRHVLIKSALRTQETLVLLVTNGHPTPLLSRIAEELIASCPWVKGVVHNRHTGPDNVILGNEYSVLKGSGSITESLGDLSFKISPASFFQINPAQAERLYAKVLELAELGGEETVLDAYCGVGTLTLSFARHVKNAIGVECVPEAVADAQDNAQRNGIGNARFVLADASMFISTLTSVDLILLNPPRKGCDPSFLDAIGRLSPKKLIYISCDPATLARDLRILGTFGYKTDLIQPFDMFPQTAHVECVAKLQIVN